MTPSVPPYPSVDLRVCWIPIAGDSMWPALRSGDRAELVALDRPANGDVLVARSPRGLVAHRVRAIAGDELLLQGDACVNADPPLAATAVLGRIARVERRGRVLGRQQWDVYRPRLGRLHRRLRRWLGGRVKR